MKHNRKNIAIHLMMCALGGYLGAYALLLRGGNFGSASTGNLLECMIVISEGKPIEALIRLLGAVLFALSFVISRFLELRTDINRKRLCLLTECAGLIACAFIPSDAHPVIALYPVFFISGFQWSVFGGTERYSCSTIFISNNTRQCATALTDYVITGSLDMKAKFRFYGTSIICFLAGGLCSAFLSGILGPVSSLFAIILPVCVLCMSRTTSEN